MTKALDDEAVTLMIASKIFASTDLSPAQTKTCAEQLLPTVRHIAAQEVARFGMDAAQGALRGNRWARVSFADWLLEVAHTRALQLDTRS